MYIFFKIVEMMQRMTLYKNNIIGKQITHDSSRPLMLGNENTSCFNPSLRNNHHEITQARTLSLPLDLIVNGVIINENLKMIKKDNNWLTRILLKNGVKDITFISYAFLNQSGKIQYKMKLND